MGKTCSGTSCPRNGETGGTGRTFGCPRGWGECSECETYFCNKSKDKESNLKNVTDRGIAKKLCTTCARLRAQEKEELALKVKAFYADTKLCAGVGCGARMDDADDADKNPLCAH